MGKKRFQECSLLVRMLRRLWYILMPYYLWKFRPRKPVEPDPEGFEPFGWAFTWRISKSMCQSHMNWYYTWEEVQENILNKLEEKRSK